MNVSSYIFQSPYPSPIQIGRPDPSATVEEEPKKAVAELSEKSAKPQPSADAYVAQATNSGASVNVAASSTDSGVSSSLNEFTTLNTQTQAADAYTSE